MNPDPNNKLVAKNRSESWKKALVKGRLQSQMNPTKLKVVRCEKEISQEKTAARLKLSASTYHAIERGRRGVSKSRAELISSFFKKPVKSIFEYQDTGLFLAV